MPRTVPAVFQEKLDDGVTTLCLLCRFDPVTPGYDTYGAAMLDQPVDYDDGDGLLRYSEIIGFQPTTISMSGDLSVDNADSQGLMPEFDFPISEVDIAAGVYDFAKFTVYLVDYLDLIAGHVVIAHGTLGKISIRDDGLSFVEEMRGLPDQLKQNITEKDSLSCRAIYGSQPPGSAIPGPIQRFPCGKDATAELVSDSVAIVGLETNRTFTVSAPTFGDDELAPGILVWRSGANNGRTYEIESNTAAGVVNLAHPTAFPIQENDEFDYRPDCNKIARDTEKGCAAEHHWGVLWPLHFRGEPDIPIGDAGSNETPGAGSSPGGGGSTNIPFETAA